jgi:phospholipid-binding lipoprotein MlaA
MDDKNMNYNKKNTGLLFVLLLATLLSGCASVPGPRDPNDPWEPFNRSMYSFNDELDKKILQPIARGYNNIMPDPVNKGITNFFSNLDDVIVLFNDLLQFKFSQAAHDAGRIVFNTTAGLLGFIDVASHMDMPKHNEDLGQTFGYWGFGEGNYVVWPFFGPSTIRDTVGDIGDSFVDPLNQVEPDADRYWLKAVKLVDKRADLLSASKVLEEAALDPYTFVRDAYLQRRNSLIHDGNPPKPILYNE